MSRILSRTTIKFYLICLLALPLLMADSASASQRFKASSKTFSQSNAPTSSSWWGWMKSFFVKSDAERVEQRIRVLTRSREIKESKIEELVKIPNSPLSVRRKLEIELENDQVELAALTNKINKIRVNQAGGGGAIFRIQ